MENLLELSNDLRRDVNAIEADLDALERNGMERGDRPTFKRRLIELTDAQAVGFEEEARCIRAERLERERVEAARELIRREEEAKRKEAERLEKERAEAEREHIRREEEASRTEVERIRRE